jgi:hypothetical protein
VQAVQVPAEQTGEAAGHVLLSRQPTHAPAGEQSVRDGSLRAAHWVFDVQVVQPPAEQTGVGAGQLALDRQPTHLFVVVSQTGVAPEHEELSAHWTH